MEVYEQDVFGQVRLVFSDLYVDAGVIVAGTVYRFLDVESTHQDVGVAVKQTDVVDDLEALKTLFYRRQHLQHRPLLGVTEVRSIGDGEVVVQVMRNPPGPSPGIDLVDKSTYTGVLATDSPPLSWALFDDGDRVDFDKEGR